MPKWLLYRIGFQTPAAYHDEKLHKFIQYKNWPVDIRQENESFRKHLDRLPMPEKGEAEKIRVLAQMQGRPRVHPGEMLHPPMPKGPWADNSPMAMALENSLVLVNKMAAGGNFGSGNPLENWF